ncbi:Uncharacterized membrane protein [Paenibacillus sp. RU4T]|nr:Uncharacterized membrane protein [Paenibacillus sp. RU4X]SIR71783.1 Uncharacterized membrane protein [Paenibacillus sp. RU4T]
MQQAIPGDASLSRTKVKISWGPVLLAAIAACVIGYSLLKNYVFDPRADFFLGVKTGLNQVVPVPAWLGAMRVHVAFACLAAASGALNFSSRLRRRSVRLHRANGYAYLISILAVSLTSGYLAPYATGGKWASIPFNLLNIAWPALAVISIRHARQGRYMAHREWMLRSYVFCFTNSCIHFFAFVLYRGAGVPYEASYIAGVYAAIAFLAAAAELFIRLRRSYADGGALPGA